jgi:hypothetical protein
MEGEEEEVTPKNCTYSHYRYIWEDAKCRVYVQPHDAHDDRNNTETIYVGTDKDYYLLTRIPQSEFWGQNEFWNEYSGELNGYKAHLILEPMSGKLIYWT